MKSLTHVLLCISLCHCALAQVASNEDNHEVYKVAITKATEPVNIDGIPDEPAWKNAAIASGFNEAILRDKEKAKRKTEVRLTYDHDNLYISCYAYDTLPYNSNTLKRDANPGENDGFWVLLDPLNQRTNGFVFSVSTYNVQIEDVISANSLDDIQWTWDNKWFSAVKRYSDHWTAEMAIPFKILRYAGDVKEWGINFYRVDIKNGQYSAWTKVPVNVPWPDFGFYGSLIWDTPPPQPGNNVSVLPYINTSYSNNNEAVESKTTLNAGFDAKVAVTTSLNVDLTVNPDFSQVDVDQQVTNLTRFNIFFPEKRPFFLENGDLYNEIGYPLIRPFYSRTIGLNANGNPIPIIGGARLSGNLNKKVRIALMNIQTKRNEDFAAQNYTALSVKRQVLKRSGISAYFLNRQGFMEKPEKEAHPLDLYGRNAGVDAKFVSNTSKWKAFASYNLSIKPHIKKDIFFYNLGVEYSTPKVGVNLHYNDVGTNYYTDMGFIGRINNYDARLDSTIRLGFRQLSGQIEYRIIPGKGSVNYHLLGLENMTIVNPSGSLNEHLNRLRYKVDFKNRSSLLVNIDRQDTRLLYPTKFTDKAPLAPGKYQYYLWNAAFESDYRKTISYGATIGQGSFYNGHLFSAILSFNYRLQYWGNIILNFEYDQLKFPEPYGENTLFLVSPRLEFYFSNNLFWTTFLQYNTQINNFNINSRLQWRYKPMSDIFLVYSDNYFSTPFLKNKNRAIVLKANYWLNL